MVSRRGFIGKLLGLLGVGIAAPAFTAAVSDEKTVEDLKATLHQHPVVKCPLLPITEYFLIETKDIAAAKHEMLGGFDRYGEPNTFEQVCYPIEVEPVDGFKRWEMKWEYIPVGRYEFCPAAHAEFPWAFAHQVRIIEQERDWTTIAVDFNSLPFMVDHLPKRSGNVEYRAPEVV